MESTAKASSDTGLGHTCHRAGITASKKKQRPSRIAHGRETAKGVIEADQKPSFQPRYRCCKRTSIPSSHGASAPDPYLESRTPHWLVYVLNSV